MSDAATVLVVGGTGQLGHEIAEALAGRPGVEVRALVRPGAQPPEKQARIDRLRARGVLIVTGDLDTPESLAAPMEGVDVVVSAVQGGERIIVDGQRALLRAAEAAGTQRMIPSDFSIDLSLLDRGDNDNLDLHIRFHEAFADSPVRPTSVLNGAFAEMVAHPAMGLVDWDAGTFSYWGDGAQPCDFTTVADTARYTAAAALDPETAGRPLRVAGDVRSMREIHALAERAADRRLRAVPLGSLEALRAEIGARRAAGGNPWSWISLQYQWCMVSGKGKLEPLDNDRYPHIRPTGLEALLRAAVPAPAPAAA